MVFGSEEGLHHDADDKWCTNKDHIIINFYISSTIRKRFKTFLFPFLFGLFFRPSFSSSSSSTRNRASRSLTDEAITVIFFDYLMYMIRTVLINKELVFVFL